MRYLVHLTSMASLLLPTMGMAEKGAGVAKRASISPLSGSVLLETVGGLLIVLALIVAMGWAVRRFGGLNRGGKGDISVLGGVSLGPRERAVLLQVGATRLLVGVAPGRVQTLHVLADDEQLKSAQAPENFNKQLKNELDGPAP